MGRGMKAEAVKEDATAVREFEEGLHSKGKGFESASLGDLKEYISELSFAGLNTEDRILALARYFWLTKRNDFYSYFAAILGGRGVYASIGERLTKSKRGEVFEGFTQPPLGSPPDAYPACTKELLDRLDASLPPERVKKALTGNHHRIPVQSFSEMKKRFEKARTMEEFLAGDIVLKSKIPFAPDKWLKE